MSASRQHAEHGVSFTLPACPRQGNYRHGQTARSLLLLAAPGQVMQPGSLKTQLPNPTCWQTALVSELLAAPGPPLPP